METKRTGPQCPREEHDVTPAAEDGIEGENAGRSVETVPAGQISREGERTATRSAGRETTTKNLRKFSENQDYPTRGRPQRGPEEDQKKRAEPAKPGKH